MSGVYTSLRSNQHPAWHEGTLPGVSAAADSSGELAQHPEAGDGNLSAC